MIKHGFYFEDINRKRCGFPWLPWLCCLGHRCKGHNASPRWGPFGVSELNTDAGSFSGGHRCPTKRGESVRDKSRSPRRTMVLRELLLGLLWFRSALLCAGEEQQCICSNVYMDSCALIYLCCSSWWRHVCVQEVQTGSNIQWVDFICVGGCLLSSEVL